MHAHPRPRLQTISLLFRLRLPKAVRELEIACQEAWNLSWGRLEMKRAHLIAVDLSAALRLEGLRNEAIVAQSLSFLLDLSKEQILPVEGALREKIVELLATLKEAAARVLIHPGREGSAWATGSREQAPRALGGSP